MTLPVVDIAENLVSALQQHSRVILTAPPGAGKSTWLPLYLLQHPAFAKQRFIMLEPRRLAAKSIASYLAAQLGEAVGQQVGYQIRLEQVHSSQTRLLIVTEGVLVRKMLTDPQLTSADVLIFDEFHERSLQTDLALALALEVQMLSEHLKILLMSATLADAALSQSLHAPVLRSEGRSFPVEIRYQAPTQEELWLQSARCAAQVLQAHTGNLLVFLPGQREIERAQQWLQVWLQEWSQDQLKQTSHDMTQAVDVYALLGQLSLAEQQAAIAPPSHGRRKVVLATNIAETSLTIDGISVVIDSGVARAARFEPRLGFSRLDTIHISQASAIQRAGRAGRLMPGVCYRLDTPEKWARRSAFTTPDILQADLLALRLDVAAWGCQVSDLFWLDPPPAAQLAAAEQTLQLLGALCPRLQLTALGQQMLRLPLEPRLSAMLLFAQQCEQQGEQGAVALAAYLAVVLDQGRRLPQSDLAMLPELQGQQARQQYQQLLSLMQVRPSERRSLSLLAPLLCSAFPDRVAQRRGQGYLLANGVGAQLAADDSLTGQDYIVVADLRLVGGQALISQAAAISLAELQQHFADTLQWQDECSFDERQGKFSAERQLKLGALILKRQSQLHQIDSNARAQAWLGYLQRHGLSVLAGQEATTQLIHRLALARQLDSATAWPELSLAADVSAAQLQWLEPYLGDMKNLAALQQLNLHELCWQQLDYAQQRRLNELLPKHWCSPLGTEAPLQYQADGSVHLEIRMQEMFGQQQSPTLGNGKIGVTLHLLSPARRPLQVTKNLESFWQNAYQDVKKEMRGRYPKHFWPDDPAQALPTNKTKKAMQAP